MISFILALNLLIAFSQEYVLYLPCKQCEKVIMYEDFSPWDNNQVYTSLSSHDFQFCFEDELNNELVRAVRGRQCRYVECLLSKGARIDQTENSGSVLLDTAIRLEGRSRGCLYALLYVAEEQLGHLGAQKLNLRLISQGYKAVANQKWSRFFGLLRAGIKFRLLEILPKLGTQNQQQAFLKRIYDKVELAVSNCDSVYLRKLIDAGAPLDRVKKNCNLLASIFRVAELEDELNTEKKCKKTLELLKDVSLYC